MDAMTKTCYLCQKKLQPNEITSDHVVPVKLGGAHTPNNLKVACMSCNSRKGAKLLSELHWVKIT